MAEVEIIKEVRLRCRVSTDGKWWKAPLADSLGANDCKIVLKKRKRKDYFIFLETGPDSKGLDNVGVSYPYEPKASDDRYKTTDDFITRFVESLNMKQNITVNSYFNPVNLNAIDFARWYYDPTNHQSTGSASTASGTASIPAFFEIIQDPYDPATVPPVTPGYYDKWNEYVENEFSPKEQPTPAQLSIEEPIDTSKFRKDLKLNVERPKEFIIVNPAATASVTATGGTGSTASPPPPLDPLGIIGVIKGTLTMIDSPEDWVFNDEELDEEYIETATQIEAEQLQELAKTIEFKGEAQSELPANTAPSTMGSGANLDPSNINFNDPSFVGAAWKGYDINTVMGLIKKTKHKPTSIFEESLKQVLYYIKQDPEIKDLREAAYLLGTAFGESSYSLQRWEADYACKSKGIPYGPGGPCSAATNYYRKSDGKANYYSLGTDSKGQCYFGRGLIQLTGKANYEKYGKLIGVDLVSNGDLAMKPENSYKVASVYMRGRTFKYILDPTAKFTTKKGSWTGLEAARRSVNGGTIGLSEINGAYADWVQVLKSASPSA